MLTFSVNKILDLFLCMIASSANKIILLNLSQQLLSAAVFISQQAFLIFLITLSLSDDAVDKSLLFNYL